MPLVDLLLANRQHYLSITICAAPQFLRSCTKIENLKVIVNIEIVIEMDSDSNNLCKAILKASVTLDNTFCITFL